MLHFKRPKNVEWVLEARKYQILTQGKNEVSEASETLYTLRYEMVRDMLTKHFPRFIFQKMLILAGIC